MATKLKKLKKQDKETNAFKLFRKNVISDYNKSYLPKEMEFPIYWKILEAKNLLSADR